jgi:Domain of unknown function (DUF222)/HNH endonuclease
MSGLWQQDQNELLHDLRELEASMRRDYAAVLALTAELDLLRDVLRISPREAKRRISHAHAVTEVPLVSGGSVPPPLPATADAVQTGDLGPEHLDVITKTLTGLPPYVAPAAVAEAEQTMVTAAASMDAHTLTRVGVRVRAVLDQDGAPPDERTLAQPINELHLSTRANGRTAFRGELEPEASALLRALLSPLAKPRPSTHEGPDQRTSAERHGDALVEILHLAAASADLPTEAGEKPHLLVTVPLQMLREGVGAGLLDGAGVLDAASARRLACDATIIPAVLGTHSEPLDLGRASYIVSTALRRALILRDGGCAFPGCDRPHRWCHSHHLRHWANGGPTTLDNLVLLCAHHHRLLHHSEWDCAIINGRPQFYPPSYIDPTRAPRTNTLHHNRQ